MSVFVRLMFVFGIDAGFIGELGGWDVQDGVLRGLLVDFDRWGKKRGYRVET